MKSYMVSDQPSSRNVLSSGNVAAGTESKFNRPPLSSKCRHSEPSAHAASAPAYGAPRQNVPMSAPVSTSAQRWCNEPWKSCTPVTAITPMMKAQSPPTLKREGIDHMAASKRACMPSTLSKSIRTRRARKHRTVESRTAYIGRNTSAQATITIAISKSCHLLSSPDTAKARIRISTVKTDRQKLFKRARNSFSSSVAVKRKSGESIAMV